MWPTVAPADNPFWMLYNGVGRVLLGVAIPEMTNYVDRAERFETYRALVQVRVAIARFTRARGEPPKTLEALVPDYLAKLPPDLFAHEAETPASHGSFHYDREGRTLASAKRTEPKATLTLTW